VKIGTRKAQSALALEVARMRDLESSAAAQEVQVARATGKLAEARPTSAPSASSGFEPRRTTGGPSLPDLSELLPYSPMKGPPVPSGGPLGGVRAGPWAES
jgi:hypothetical protein